ncbi:leucine-rich repeat-containing protein 18 [Hoplias malabaricus]|uniref:leucine-rich repeat-containing protein 18 n=1 Tax=Hoplias malabaricus TaxID=27720 RepID=UPI0034624EE6
MGKGKKEGPKGKKITLKMARKALKITPDGKWRLDLSNMGLNTFPKCILNMIDIEELDLSRNRLKTIPDFIGQFKKIHWLDLHSNYIEQLPKSIGQLEALCHLNVSNNSLGSSGLPEEIGSLRSLQTLNLGMNRLTALPPTMSALSNLKELGLFDNQFTVLPECILVLSNLKKINTKRNPLDHTQGESKDKMSEELYVMRGEDLCKLCLEKCKEERQKNKQKKCSNLIFSGLITPNSVAQTNQELWRITTA